MKKILILIMAIALNSFASIFESNIGIGQALTRYGGESVEKPCGSSCADIALDFDLRFGGPLAENIWLAGELGSYDNIYFGSGGRSRFSTLFVGPSLLYDPIEKLQLSVSVGLTSTWNISNNKMNDFYTGAGFGATLSAAYKHKINDQKSFLFGTKVYALASDVKEINSGDFLTTIGASIFFGVIRK